MDDRSGSCPAGGRPSVAATETAAAVTNFTAAEPKRSKSPEKRESYSDLSRSTAGEGGTTDKEERREETVPLAGGLSQTGRVLKVEKSSKYGNAGKFGVEVGESPGGMGREICKFKTGSKKVLLADSAAALSPPDPSHYRHGRPLDIQLTLAGHYDDSCCHG